VGWTQRGCNLALALFKKEETMSEETSEPKGEVSVAVTEFNQKLSELVRSTSDADLVELMRSEDSPLARHTQNIYINNPQK
jgi:hypothetical protein